MAKTFVGVSMIPMTYKDEVRQIKSELLCFLGHPSANGGHIQLGHQAVFGSRLAQHIFITKCI